MIQDAEQNEYVRKLKQDLGLPWVTIGLTSEGNADDSCWYWSGYTAWTDYQNWDSGQPANNGGDEDCVGLGMHSQNAAGKWHDCKCDELCSGSGKLPFVCRIDLHAGGSSSTDGSCPNDCSVSLEQGECDSITSTCTCYAGWKGADCGCPESQTCSSVTIDGKTSNCVKRGSSGGELVCFPSSSTVQHADGSVRTIDQLKQGDLILAADPDGRLVYDEISFLSIAAPNAVDQTFVRVTTDANVSLTLTLTHHLSVGPTCCYDHVVQAKDLRVGDTVWLTAPIHSAVAGAELVPARVASLSPVSADGLHNPLLTGGGYPIVDGVVTASNNKHAQSRARFWVPWLGWGCGLTGTCQGVAKMIHRAECAKLQLEHAFWGEHWWRGQWQKTADGAALECPRLRDHIVFQ